MTSVYPWSLLAAAIACEVSAALSLKGAQQAPGLYLVVAAGYVAAFVLLVLVLRAGMDLGVTYGIWGASGVALTALASHLIFDEPLTTTMLIGIGCIAGGVLIIELGAQAAHRRAAVVAGTADAAGAASASRAPGAARGGETW